MVDIVIPVYNEERVLAATVHRLTAFLDRELPHRWRIVIANNQSTDRTREVGESLSSTDARVSVLNLSRKGRGVAVREAWNQSQADIVSYMDVDLSTDLRYFPLLVESVRTVYDMSVASRLLPASRVVRSFKREQLSRAYNRLIRMVFRTRFTDTQCGFKAMRRDVARVLLPHVRGDGWFFDAELLILAERNGFRVLELPVEWTDDLDSRVVLGSVGPGTLPGDSADESAAPAAGSPHRTAGAWTFSPRRIGSSPTPGSTTCSARWRWAASTSGAIARFCDVGETDRVFDLGCGTGSLRRAPHVRELSRRGSRSRRPCARGAFRARRDPVHPGRRLGPGLPRPSSGRRAHDGTGPPPVR